MSKSIPPLALLLCAVAPAWSVAAPLELDDAVRHALIHNPELQAADAQSAAAEARAKAANGAFLPQLGVRYLARRSDNPLDAFADKLNTRSVTAANLEPAAINQPGTSSVHATQLALELPLYTGGRLLAGAREARATAESAQYNLAHRRQVIAYRTIEAYRSAQAEGLALQIADDAVLAARDHAETTARLVRQGRIVTSDRMTAELNLAAMESLREQVAGRERRARAELRLVTGLPDDRELVLPAWNRLPPPLLPSEDNAAQSAERRADLKAQEAQLVAARARIHAARAAFQPQIGVVAADTWYDDNAALDNKSQSIMGVVSLNLFNGGRDWHGLNAARRAADEAEANRDAARRRAQHELRLAHSQLTEAVARRRIAAAGVDKAHETVHLIKQRYGEGRTILIDLLMAERVLVEARNEELAAALQSELAALALQLAAGTLPLPGDVPVN